MSHSASPPSLRRRFGYRGRALTLLGAVWVLVGIGVLLHPYDHPESALLHEQIPVQARVVLWMGAGVCSLVTAWWPTGADRVGFMALVIPATIRGGSYAWSAFLGMVTNDDLGRSAQWVDALAWVAVVAFVQLVAAWPEPSSPLHVEDGESGRR